MTIQRMLATLLLTALPAVASAAPDLPRLVKEAVRVELVGGKIINGKVESQSSDTLIIDGARIQVADIRAIDVADGIADGVVRGIVGGTVSGILLGAIGDEASSWGGQNHPRNGTGAAIGGGLIGGALGALIGAAVDRAHPSWVQRIVFTSPSATIAPVVTLRSVGLSGSVRW